MATSSPGIWVFAENGNIYVNIYEVNNNGNRYDSSFVIGAGILFGGGLFGKRRG